MNLRSTGVKTLRWRWMMPIGRSRSQPRMGTAARAFPAISRRTVGSGRMLSPAPISTACLMVSMLSNSITLRTETWLSRK